MKHTSLERPVVECDCCGYPTRCEHFTARPTDRDRTGYFLCVLCANTPGGDQPETFRSGERAARNRTANAILHALALLPEASDLGLAARREYLDGMLFPGGGDKEPSPSPAPRVARWPIFRPGVKPSPPEGWRDQVVVIWSEDDSGAHDRERGAEAFRRITGRGPGDWEAIAREERADDLADLHSDGWVLGHGCEGAWIGILAEVIQ